jgi:hypothetical protein
MVYIVPSVNVEAVLTGLQKGNARGRKTLLILQIKLESYQIKSFLRA